MKYPIYDLGEHNNNFTYAEFPEDPEKGSFLFVRETADKISIKVDRFTTIPFYYVVHEGRLYGSTKFDRLMNVLPGSFSRSMNCLAAIEFLRTNSMIGHKTLMENVDRIPYGHELHFDKRTGQISLEQYWQLPGDVRDESEQSFLDGLKQRFSGAVENYVKRFDRVGMHLSGGMDSRQILAVLKCLGVDCQAITYGVPQNLDVLIAKKLAQCFQLRHHYYEWESIAGFQDNFQTQFMLTDGMQALFHGHGIDAYQDEAKHVDTVLYGHFLDFFIQGHFYDAHFEEDRGFLTAQHLYEKFDGGPCSVMRGDSIEPYMLTSQYRGAYAASIYAEINKFDYMIPEKRYDAMYLVHHGLRRLLPQPQSGAHYVDFYQPGLDRDYFEYAWSVPGQIRRDRQLQKKLLLALNPDVAKVPIVRDNRLVEHLDERFTARLKFRAQELLQNRFRSHRLTYDYYGADFAALANESIYPWLRQSVLSSGLLGHGFLNGDYIHDLFAEDHFHPNVSFGHYGALLTLCKFSDCYWPK